MSCCRPRGGWPHRSSGNNQKAVRALLASYHRIDDAQTNDGLWIEADVGPAVDEQPPAVTTSPPTATPSSNGAAHRCADRA